MRARKEEQRGTGHARYAAEEPFIWKINRDGTWRRLIVLKLLRRRLTMTALSQVTSEQLEYFKK